MVGRIHFGSNSSPDQDIKCTFITTENFFPLLGCPCQVLFSPGQSCLPLAFIKHPTSVMEWGCFAASGPDRLHVVEGMESTIKYCDVLEKVEPSSVRDLFHGPWLYQQDNVSCNAANKVKKRMEDSDMMSLSLLAQSPDLNSIENLWCNIGQLIAKDKPTTTRSLIELTIQSWFRVVSPESLSDLVAGMPKPCLAVIDNKSCQQNIRMHLITSWTFFRATTLISKSYVQKISKNHCNF